MDSTKMIVLKCDSVKMLSSLDIFEEIFYTEFGILNNPK